MVDRKDGNQQNEAQQRKHQTDKGTWDIRPYLAIGLTAILVVLVCMAIFFFIYRFQGFSDGVGKILTSLRGVFFGFVLAYLLNPVMRYIEKALNKRMFIKGEKSDKQKRVVRGLSVACVMGIFLAIIAVLIILIGPQLVQSVQELVLSMSDKVDALMEWIEKLTKNNGVLEGKLETLVADASVYLENWLQEKFLSVEGDIITSVTTGVYNAIRFAFNCIVGVIVAVYVLMTKERFVGQAKKLVYAIFKPRLGNIVMEIVHKADEVFGGFFIGKIIDSIIIGCICLVGLYIMRMPYVVLISVIVGVTNIIPFFGPYIGAIPSIILIFLVNPIQALYFIIFIFILQQVDGNIIGPKILGDTTGLSPFWVIFACLLFGGSFGIVGMIFGVPIFAVIYYLIKRVAEHFLRKKKLPEDTEEYVKLDSVDIHTNKIKELDEDKKGVMQREKSNRNKKKEN